MKLYHEAFSEALNLTTDGLNVIIVENQILFYSMIKSFSKQVNNGDGDFVLSENDVPIQLGHYVQFVRDVFSIENTDKALLTKIKNNIITLANDEENFSNTADLIGGIERYFDSLLLKLEYPVRINGEIALADIVKAINFEPEQDTETLTDAICSYVKSASILQGKNVFAFLNLKQFLPEIEAERLVKFCEYEKIYLLLFEGVDKYNTKYENKIIVDKDLCTI